MACRMFDANPFSAPMLEYCSLDACEQTLVKLQHILTQENAFKNIVCKYGGHFVSAWMC